MTRGLAFGFIAYALFTCGDAAVKAVGPTLNPFQIAFFVSALASVAIVATRPKSEPWSEALRMRRPRLVMMRGVLASISWVGGIHAFTTIPFAEAFVLIFLAPSLGALLSQFYLGERPGRLGWAAIIVGLLGVVIAIRPGFRELGTGHAGAALCAVSFAGTLVVLRHIAATEARTTIMIVTTLTILLVTGVAMIPEFRWPTTAEFAWLAASGTIDGFGQIFLLLATRHAAAALVGATHYSQLIWAVLIGWAVFGERPDGWVLTGLAAIMASGLLAVAAARTTRR